LQQYFSLVYGGDTFPAKKPDPSGVHKILEQFKAAPADTLFIGDSEVDVQTARNAGAISAIVNHGFGRLDRTAHPADIYLDRLTDLVPLLRTHPE
jgi:phosphoglycolate phosphatase